ncbi:hypothetical protein A2630_04770 [Candidatus Woesebacteria bacterium RIFCSPHIGHO2_01_FULL_44_10]|uniref:Uncharacterized protein n=1 Tax=Candidatus Woesebacteria bacterium RIFCSPLOWO2_01_FULL_44_14 TaxID=1802525 RepID=A0A1F8C273_9BACT|nr:MAG: hypothetical protein A2630_04770 [Candidatus Woesebacteria bacterium RIFCSPHIGHO2_01_FULL_44_10]OGM69648.1 MAG: hypothetical protein A2975_00865 [Candidatus Woesebacteria bacterium RIFCSPLOWO2_01_FULL_44_14]
MDVESQQKSEDRPGEIALGNTQISLADMPVVVDEGLVSHIDPTIYPSEFEVWQFKSHGEEYVYKIMKGRRQKELGTAHSAATQKKQLYEQLKKYFGDYLLGSHFIIGMDNNGKEKLVIIQPKFQGRIVRMDQFGKADSETSKVSRQVDKLVKKLSQAANDPQLTNFPGFVKDVDGNEMFSLGNMLASADGTVRIIDW